MHESLDPYRRVSDEALETILNKFEGHEVFEDSIDTPRDLREFDYALALATLLVIPDNKSPIDHTRDLSLAARKGYEANATSLADKQHSAARILADYHGFDWKDDVIAHEEERIGELE